MKTITLLPADSYVVINKTIITEYDKKVIIDLYQPIIGPIAVSLYFTFISDLDKYDNKEILKEEILDYIENISKNV